MTEEEDLEKEMNYLKKVLSASGYQKWALDIPGRKSPHPRKDSRVKPNGHVTLPYVRGVTEAISRKLRSVGIAAS